MNIKSLLIGSAAAMVAVSGARAADAVVIAEPEPVEYVRVCDAYGSGFFYIPGTETCLSISGYVWYQIGAGSDVAPSLPFFAGDTTSYYGYADGWNKRVRARVNFDARSDTEWGTLRGFIRLQSDFASGTGDGPVSVDQGYIQLGGLMMGYSESFWVDSKNGGPSNYGSHSWGGMYYGYQQRHLIGYRWNGPNGLFAAVSLEDDALGGEGYMPDVVAKVGITQGWGTVWARVAYDESYDGSLYAAPFVPLGGGSIANDGGFAAALGAVINVPNMPGSSLRVMFHYADGSHAYNTGAPNSVFAGGGGPFLVYGGAEWNILASYNHQFSSTFGVSVGVQYFSDLYYATTDISSGVDAWAAEAHFVWFPVENFEIRGEVVYSDLGSFSPLTTPGLALDPDPDGSVSGYLRFTRYF